MLLALDADDRDLCLGLRGRLGREADLDSEATRRVLAELGVFLVETPASAGGLELGLGRGAIICEELGRHAARDPYRASALLADLLAGEPGHPDEPQHPDQPQHAGLIGKVGAGDVLAVAAGWDAPVNVSRADGRIELTGRCRTPDDTAAADYLLIPASGEHGRVIAAVPADGEGVAVIPGQRTEIRLENARAFAVSSPAGSALARARVRQAAHLLGLAVGALQLAVARVGSRRQFGRPIGENQAVSFPLARHFAASEAVRLLLHKAAWLDEQRADAALAALQALGYAAELALDATAWAVHVHGAAGLTRREPVHRYYLLAAAEAVRWGTPRELWREAARLRQGLSQPPAAAAARSAAI